MRQMKDWKRRLLVNPDIIHTLAKSLPAVDVAETLTTLDDAQLQPVLEIMSVKDIALMLEEWDIPTSWRVLSLMSREKMAAAIRAMPSDDRADLLGAVPEIARESLLLGLAADAAHVRELLAYAAESSGGIMATELLAVRPEWTSEEALAVVMRDAQAAETAYYVYVTDAGNKLLGVLSLRELVLAAPQTKVSDIMRAPVTVHEDEH